MFRPLPCSQTSPKLARAARKSPSSPSSASDRWPAPRQAVGDGGPDHARSDDDDIVCCTALPLACIEASEARLQIVKVEILALLFHKVMPNETLAQPAADRSLQGGHRGGHGQPRRRGAERVAARCEQALRPSRGRYRPSAFRPAEAAASRRRRAACGSTRRSSASSPAFARSSAPSRPSAARSRGSSDRRRHARLCRALSFSARRAGFLRRHPHVYCSIMAPQFAMSSPTGWSPASSMSA